MSTAIAGASRRLARICVRLRDAAFKIVGIQFTKLDDENIFHVLAHELMTPAFNRGAKRLVIIENGINRESNVQKWRRFVLQTQFPRVTYAKIPRPLRWAIPVLVKKTAWNHDWWSFREAAPDPFACNVVHRIHDLIEFPPQRDRYVLLVQRHRDDRYLYEAATRRQLGEYLQHSLEGRVRECEIGQLSVGDQVRMISGAAVLIGVHGAALTNMIFSTPSCPVVEISFRKVWRCDPVCDDHFTGRKSPSEICGRERPYHKADFYVLSRIIGKPHYEVSAVECEGYNNRNPIARKSVFVDGERLVELVKTLV